MQVQRLAMLVVLSLTAAAAQPARAENPIAAGTLEFSPSLAFSRSTFSAVGGASSSLTHLSLEAALSRAMTERFALSGSLLLQHRAVQGDGQNGYGATAGVKINFSQQGQLIPFVSGGLGAVSFSSDGGTDRAWLLPVFRAGFRTMIGETRSMNVSVGFQHERNPEGLEQSSNVFDVGVGVSMFRPRSQ